MQNIILTLMSVLVTLVLLGSGVSIYESTNADAKITQAIGNADTILSGVQSIYDGKSSYQGISNAVLLSANDVFPPSMVSGVGSTATVTSVFGEPVTVAQTWGAYIFFTLTYDNLQKSACVRMATGVRGKFFLIEVNGLYVTYPKGVLFVASPVSVARASKTCRYRGNSNTVTWYSY